MHRFWQTFLDNLPFMLVVLPVVGACLVLAVSRFGIESIRRTVITNVLLTFSLSVLMVAHYDPHARTDSGKPRLLQMQSSLRWLAEAKRVEIPQITRGGKSRVDRKRLLVGPDIRLRLGVDGVSLWFIPLTTLLMIPAVLAGWEKGSSATRQNQPAETSPAESLRAKPPSGAGGEIDRWQAALFYALLLLLEAAMIGVFVAVDVILFCLFLEFTLLPLFLLIGWWGDSGRRRVVERLFVYKLAGGLLIFLGLIAVVLAHSRMRASESHPQPALTFSTEQLVTGAGGVPGIPLLSSRVGSAARRHWEQVSPWIFFALLVGFAIHVPLIPLHGWLPATNLEAPPAVSALLMGVSPAFGCYGLLRFVLPLFPEQCAQASGFVTALALFGVVYAAFFALLQSDIKKAATYIGLGQVGLGAAGIFSLNQIGISGGVLHLVGLGVAMGTMLLVIGELEYRYRGRDIQTCSGLMGRFPRLGLLLILTALSLAGTPGFVGFVGEVLALLGVFWGPGVPGDSPVPTAVNPAAALGGLVGSLLVAWCLLSMLGSLLGSRAPADSGEQQIADLPARHVVAFLPAAVVMVGMGVYPQFFLDRVEPSVSPIMSLRESVGTARDDAREEQPASIVRTSSHSE